MFGIFVAVVAVIAIGIYFGRVFIGETSCCGVSCNSCPSNRRRENCPQSKLKDSLLKIYKEDEEPE
ncbi:MAG: hypothetical protein LBK06_04290 [Planctomycetaceae bacterium]|jgi:hypothetical protein|nr:hypothetical protein [Planctomycetaceae bacterium]